MSVTGFGGTIDVADELQGAHLTLGLPNAGTTLERLLPGTEFTLSVTKEPVGQICIVRSPNGTMGFTPITDPITCTPGSGRLLLEFGVAGLGGDPLSGLTWLGGQTFMGVTQSGAAHGFGSIYTVRVNGSAPAVTNVYDFPQVTSAPSQAIYPPTPVPNHPGSYIGASAGGGSSFNGTIYSFLSSGNYAVVDASFDANYTGRAPTSPLLEVNGSYYGTALLGGTYQEGTLYHFDPRYITLTPVADFGSPGLPLQHPAGKMVLTFDGTVLGVALGTTSGTTNTGGGVFAFDPGGGAEAACLFNSPSGPYEPSGGLTAGANNGRYYGVTAAGGAYGAGTVYLVRPPADYCRVVHSFTGGPIDGGYPIGAPFVSQAGNLYVTTNDGGRYGRGTVVELSPDGTVLATLYEFGENDGPQQPRGQLIEDPASGYLYGITRAGGPGLNNGTIYQIR